MRPGRFRRLSDEDGLAGVTGNALQQFAWQTTQSEPWASAYYHRKRAEGKSHTVAVRTLANVWVRIIFALWFHRRCYETATFEQTQRQHARKAA